MVIVTLDLVSCLRGSTKRGSWVLDFFCGPPCNRILKKTNLVQEEKVPVKYTCTYMYRQNSTTKIQITTMNLELKYNRVQGHEITE